MAQLIFILIGLVILTLGRKLFWLLVGTVGFLVGLVLAAQWLSEQPDWVILVAALLGGIVGALLAIFVQKIAVSIAGFVVGGWALIWLLESFNLDLGQWQWLLAIVGGIIGLILAISLFEAALIVMSVLVGTILIVQVTKLDALIAALLFLALIVLGIVVQVKMWQRESY
jgi:hypothetical protein